MKYLAFDPGETTGVALYHVEEDAVFTCSLTKDQLIKHLTMQFVIVDNPASWVVLCESPAFGKTVKVASFYEGYIAAIMTANHNWCPLPVHPAMKRPYEVLARKFLRKMFLRSMPVHESDALAHIFAYTKKFFKEDYEKLIALADRYIQAVS